MNTLSPSVTQLSEANPSSASNPRAGIAAAADVRQQLSGKHVCPFCGVIRADALQPCPRCTMEDSSATRSATRQRIGPWFVLQARNPSAPGMRYVTLLSLVRKGHVTPRSIVRGPTTHQLWTFAASVRGLSREFGLCYHCGEQIDPAAPNCSHCLKTQDLPADPDALLEPVPEMSVSAQPASSETGMDGGTSLDLQVDPDPDDTPMIPSAVPRPAPPIGEPAVGGRPANRPRAQAPTALATRDAVQRAAASGSSEETILSARELAAAFQLDFKPPGQQSGRRWGFFRTVAALLLIAAIGTGIVMFLRPELRQQSVEWLSDKWSALRAELDKPAGAPIKPIPTARPDPTPDPVDPAPRAPAPVAPAPKEEPPAPEAPAVAPPVEPPAPAARVEPAAPVEPEVPASPAPKPPAPRPSEPVSALPQVGLWDEVAIPDNITIDQALDLGQRLRSQAMDAADSGNWGRAAHIYQQIQRLPREAWPPDLQVRLDVAKRRAG